MGGGGGWGEGLKNMYRFQCGQGTFLLDDFQSKLIMWKFNKTGHPGCSRKWQGKNGS